MFPELFIRVRDSLNRCSSSSLICVVLDAVLIDFQSKNSIHFSSVSCQISSKKKTRDEFMLSSLIELRETSELFALLVRLKRIFELFEISELFV